MFCLTILTQSLQCLGIYVYSETVLEYLDDDDFVELLHLSDFYMLPGLKRVIAQNMAKILSTDNCLDWLKKGLEILFCSFIIKVLSQKLSKFRIDAVVWRYCIFVL